MSLAPNGKTLSEGILAFETSKTADRQRELLRGIYGKFEEHALDGALFRLGPAMVRVMKHERIKHRELRRAARRLAKAYLTRQKAVDELIEERTAFLKRIRLLEAEVDRFETGYDKAVAEVKKAIAQGFLSAMVPSIPPNPHATKSIPPPPPVPTFSIDVAETMAEQPRPDDAFAKKMAAQAGFKAAVLASFQKTIDAKGFGAAVAELGGNELSILMEAMR